MDIDKILDEFREEEMRKKDEKRNRKLSVLETYLDKGILSGDDMASLTDLTLTYGDGTWKISYDVANGKKERRVDIIFPEEAKQLYFRKVISFIKQCIEKGEVGKQEDFISIYLNVARNFGIPTREFEPSRGCFYDTFYDPTKRVDIK